nr:hypothetical protein Hi04_10k_c5380_00017 [uncultured bacterium]
MTPMQEMPRTVDAKQEQVEQRDDVGDIQETIEQTRVEMSKTIGELQERLSPAHIKAQIREATIGKVEEMAQRASDTMYEARQSVVSTVTSNPVPAALVGIGLAWLWMNRRNGGSSYEDTARRWRYRGGGYGRDYERYPDESYRRFQEEGTAYGRDDPSESSLASKAKDAVSGASDKISGIVGQASDKVSGAVGQASDKISGAVGQVREAGTQFAARTKERVSGMYDQAQQTAERVKTGAQEQAQMAQDRFNRAMDENPLAVGAIALAVGTAIGLAIPQTRKENEWMGEARDNLFDTAQSAVQNATSQMREAARNPGGNGDMSQQQPGGGGDMSQSYQGGA